MPRNSLFIPLVIFSLALGVALIVFVSRDTTTVPESLAEILGTDSAPYDGPLGEEYSMPEYGFSFRYPKGFTVRPVNEDGGDLFMVEPEEASKDSGFQVFVFPFDEEGPITPDRIEEDLPDFTIESPQEFTLSNTIPALTFVSANEIGRMREAWFVYDGFLYQVTAPVAFDAELSAIMATWRFSTNKEL